MQKGVENIEGKHLSFWNKANITTLKEQAQLRGYRFTVLETKGGVAPGSGPMTKQSKFKKADYLRVLMYLLQESQEI